MPASSAAPTVGLGNTSSSSTPPGTRQWAAAGPQGSNSSSSTGFLALLRRRQSAFSQPSADQRPGRRLVPGAGTPRAALAWTALAMPPRPSAPQERHPLPGTTFRVQSPTECMESALSAKRRVGAQVSTPMTATPPSTTHLDQVSEPLLKRPQLYIRGSNHTTPHMHEVVRLQRHLVDEDRGQEAEDIEMWSLAHVIRESMNPVGKEKVLTI
jgi:hypothetical protein